MKLLYCKYCEDIISPHRKAFERKYCECRKHSCFWVDPKEGILIVTDHSFNENTEWQPKAFVLGIHNALLMADEFPEPQSPKYYENCFQRDKETVPSLNSKVNSLIVKVRPNYTDRADCIYEHTLKCKKCSSQLEFLTIDTSLSTSSHSFSNTIIICKNCHTTTSICRENWFLNYKEYYK